MIIILSRGKAGRRRRDVENWESLTTTWILCILEGELARGRADERGTNVLSLTRAHIPYFRPSCEKAGR